MLPFRQHGIDKMVIWMKKRIIAIIMLAAMLLSCGVTALAQGVPTVSGASISCEHGETVKYSVSISGNSGLTAFMIKAQSSSEKIKLDKTAVPGDFSASGSMVSSGKGNYINVMWYANDAVYTNGELFSFDVHVAEDTPDGVYPIVITCDVRETLDADLNETELKCIDGSITVAGGAPVNPFADIGTCSESFRTAIIWANTNGIASGTSATTYNPDGACTRGQVVAFLWRAAGRPEPSTTAGNPFKDVSESAYYYEAILWAAENNIVSGYTADTFVPDKTVTRAQFVTFLWRYFGRPDPTSSANPFNDVARGSFYDAILWGSENGIVAGYDSGSGTMSFKPDNPCTRAHIAAFLYRALA